MEIENKIIGRKPVLEALKQKVEIEKIWLLQGTTGELEKTLRAYCKKTQTPMSLVPSFKLDRLSAGNHQGVIAQTSLYSYQDFKSWLADLDQDKSSIPVILDGITDVRNLGAICRSAEIFGAKHIILATQQSAIINEEAIKASAGGLLHLNITRVKSLAVAVEELQMIDFRVFASSLQGKDLTKINIESGERIALILGSEESGVRRHLLKISDEHIKIPQVGSLNSLNVSVAAGVILYELRNQIN